MRRWWLLHVVGDADLGVSSDLQDPERRQHRELRQGALHEITDPVALRDRLVRLRWDGAVTGQCSPLAAATHALPDGDPVRLVLVATQRIQPSGTRPIGTRPIADALVAALNRVPDAFGARVAVTLVQVEGTQHSVGLAEDEVTAALLPYLQQAGENDRVLITWGSGSTQLALGSVEAAIRARREWLFANVGPHRPAQPYDVLDPSEELDVDPLVPLVRRWRYHDLVTHLITSQQIPVSEEIKRELVANEERWQQAHLRPTVQNLRRLMTDALVRGDATGGFAARAYLLAQYQQLRKRDVPRPLDLIAWAQQQLHPKAQLGDMLTLIRQEKTNHKVSQSKKTTSGQWLISDTVVILNKAGVRAGHELAPPPAELRRSLRGHLATLPPDQSPVPDQATLLPALSAWYVAIVGKNAAKPKERHNPTQRDHPIQIVSEKGADHEVGRYLGFTNSEDVDRRYLILGTHQGSATDAADLAHRVNTLSTSEVAVADTVPDPTATPPFDTGAAYALLRKHFELVRTDVGALVLAPTGPKPLVFPLLTAALRLATEEGIPLFLRQLVGSRAMHLLPLHFGADYLLLRLAGHALDILELDVAVRLLGTCSAGHELADRADHLRRALRCDNPEPGSNWPATLPGTWSRQDRSSGLAAQRVEVWADFAETRQEPAHRVRAVMGAYAVLDRSIRVAQPPQRGRKKPGKQAWESFTKQMHQHAECGDRHAQALCALLHVRNDLPISHGVGVAHDLDVMIARELGSRRPVTVAELLRLAANALRRQFGDVAAGTETPSLSALLEGLRADVRETGDCEEVRLARAQAGIRQIQTDIIDLLGKTAVEAVATPERDE